MIAKMIYEQSKYESYVARVYIPNKRLIIDNDINSGRY